jgi:7-cyano-7-deazaguanine synthase
MTTTPAPPDAPLAVLVSGGLDSAILLADSLRHRSVVHPVYVRFGLAWEEVELQHLRRFLHALRSETLRPLTILEQPVLDLYGGHWSVTGNGVPNADTPDEAVFLPGRNVLLCAKAALWCHLHRVPALALATLRDNPFPDATPSFFVALEGVLNQAVGGNVRALRPYAELDKVDVLKRGAGFPLEHTFSCIQPVVVAGEGRHCGTCNKCAERRKGFHRAALPDPTPYHARETACSP